MKFKSIFPLFVILLVIMAGCGDSVEVVEREGEPDVYGVVENNTQMNAAMEKARQSVDTFIKALQNPGAAQTFFSIKAKFTDGDEVEHIWLENVTYDGKKFQGKIGNEPLHIRNISLGDEVSVMPKDISDWMFVENGKLVGGFTLRVLRNQTSGEERKKFDESIPFVIE